jgi:hypothetical protein
MASKESEGQGARKNGIKAKMVGVKNYLYNPTNKTVLERTCMSWGEYLETRKQLYAALNA